MLATADKNTRIECVRMLGDIGTKNQSIAAMNNLARLYPQDNNLQFNMMMAAKKITTRP